MLVGRGGALMVGFGTRAPALALRFSAALGGGEPEALGDGLTIDGGLGGFWGVLPVPDIRLGWGRALFGGAGAVFPAEDTFGGGATLCTVPGRGGAGGFLFGTAAAPAAPVAAGFLGGCNVDFFFVAVLFFVAEVLFVLFDTLLLLVLFVLFVLLDLFVVFVVPLPRLGAFFFFTPSEGPAVGGLIFR